MKYPVDAKELIALFRNEKKEPITKSTAELFTLYCDEVNAAYKAGCEAGRKEAARHE